MILGQALSAFKYSRTSFKSHKLGVLVQTMEWLTTRQMLRGAQSQAGKRFAQTITTHARVVGANTKLAQGVCAKHGVPT